MSKRRRRRPARTVTPTEEMSGLAGLLGGTPVATLDLHGYTASEARARVRDFVARHGRVSTGRIVHIVTGKGTRSEGPAILLDLVRDMIDGEASDSVAEYGGLIGGGGWVVRLR